MREAGRCRGVYVGAGEEAEKLKLLDGLRGWRGRLGRVRERVGGADALERGGEDADPGAHGSVAARLTDELEAVAAEEEHADGCLGRLRDGADRGAAGWDGRRGRG